MKKQIELSEKLEYRLKSVRNNIKARKDKEEKRMGLISVRDELRRKANLIENDVNTLDAELKAENETTLDGVKNELIDEVMSSLGE